jgi:hypothetical protein
MAQRSAVNTTKKKVNQTDKNPIETLNSTGSPSLGRQDSKTSSPNIFDQFFGNYDTGEYGYEEYGLPRPEKKAPKKQRQEFSVFSYQHYYEKETVKKQIKELTEQIKKEIELLQMADSALMAEIKDIQKMTVDSLPENPGIYHVRFMEILIGILKTIRAKVGESKTWLQAMMTKKKKRGSLFATLSKKKGTQYSLSTEINTARSVQ